MSLTVYLYAVWLRARTALKRFAAQEPVRLRVALLSLFAAGAFLVPALANADVAGTLASAGVIALQVLVGESTRDKVTPAE
ncbi:MULTISPECIES: hypothetical protein [unclassified Streptomyces]|uniref:hypothetical protein n=1 Tax=unclassified Streptomyces TaxID=2593676 RepID=UPI0036EDF00F